MYQFIHIETYARKASKVGKKSAWTARDIANEADRKDGAHPHVKEAQPPSVLFGMLPSEVVDFAEAEVAKEAITGKTKDGKPFSKGVRSDVPIVLAGVASYPNDGENLDQWRTLTVDWLKVKYGNGLRSVIEHTDEEHPHLHFYVVADKPSRTRALYHDGFKEAEASVKMGEKTTAGKAYREAMKGFQDEFWKGVGAKVGMARSGPKRARLSRDEWAKVKAENLMIAETFQQAQIKEAEADAYFDKALREAETKSKEATDILRNASEFVKKSVREKLGVLVNEEARLEKWGAWAAKIDEKLKPQIEAGQKAFQPDGALSTRIAPKVAQLGGTQTENPNVRTRVNP